MNHRSSFSDDITFSVQPRPGVLGVNRLDDRRFDLMLIWSSAPRACGQCLTRPFSRLYGPLGFVNGCPRARDRSPTGHQRYSSTRFIDGNPDAGTQYLLFLGSDPWRSPGSASVIQRTITPAMGADHIIEACSVWPDLGVEVSQYSTSSISLAGHPYNILKLTL